MPAFSSEPREFGGRRQLGLAAGFFVLSVVVSSLPVGAQQAIAAGLRLTLLRPFIYTQETLTRARIRATETDALQARVDSLLASLTETARTREENVRLRALLGIGERLGRDYRAAEVVRPGTTGSESMFVVSLGSRHGVVLNSPVIDHRGLVGVIREVRPTTAIGIDWTHPDFRASGMDREGSVSGILRASRSAFREADLLVLEGAPYNTLLSEGALVVTSGLGGVYPRGVPVGTVRQEAGEGTGWRRSYFVEPLVNPASVTHVLVRVGAIGPDDLEGIWSESAVVLPPESADSLGSGVLP
jgi:cell shape-determining protein MreC